MSSSILEQNVTVVASVSPPFVEECFDQYPDNCSYPGTEILTLWRLLSFGSIQVSWLKADSRDDAIECLRNGSADVHGSLEPVDYLFEQNRLEDVWPLPTVVETFLGYVFEKKTAMALDKFILLTVYPLNFLVIVLAAYAVAILLPVLHGFLLPQLLPKYKISSKRVSTSTIILFLTMLLALYGNLLSIHLATPTRTSLVPFKNLEELVDRLIERECHIITKGIVFDDFASFFRAGNLYRDSSILDSRLRTRLQLAHFKNPPTVVSEASTLGHMVAKMMNLSTAYKCPVIIDYSPALVLYSRLPDVLPLQTVVEQKIPPLSYSYFYRRNASKSKIRSLEIAFSIGSPSELYHSVVSQMFSHSEAGRIRNDEDDASQPEALALPHVIDSIYFLVGGWAIGAVWLTAEKVLEQFSVKNHLMKFAKRRYTKIFQK